MFVLRFRNGERYPYGPTHFDLSGRYVRHTSTWGKGDGISTTDLERAKVYNTEAGAKSNRYASKCEIIPVTITLK